MVGRRPNHPESAMITLVKCLGYREGKIAKTFVRWNRRSLKRAALGTGDFYANCVWGPFPGRRGGIEMDLAFPNATQSGGVDFEIDGFVYHSGFDKDRDTERDAVLKDARWIVVRVTTDQVYRIFVPMINQFQRQRGIGK
jgi:hypothetical protein